MSKIDIKERFSMLKSNLRDFNVDKIINWLKSAKEIPVQVKMKDKYSDYIAKDTVEKLGAVDYNNGKIITRDGKAYCIYRLSFITPNGIDSNIDMQNKQYVHELVNALEHDFKICFVDENRYMLENNIAFFRKRLADEKNPKLKTLIEHELEIMKSFDQEKSTSLLLYISEIDEAVLHKNSNGLILEKYSYEEVKRLFRQLNNRME